MAAACEETSDHRLQPDQSASCTPLALARLAPRTRAGIGPHVVSTTVPTTMHGRLFPGATLCSPRGAGLMRRLRCKDRDTAICVHAEAARAWHDTQQPLNHLLLHRHGGGGRGRLATNSYQMK